MDLKNSNLLRRPLVTGAGGFIGSHLCRALATLPNVELIYAVDLPGSTRLKSLASIRKVKVIEFDLSFDGLINRLDMNPSVVFALAAINGTSRFYTSPFTILQASSIPTLNTIKEFYQICPIIYSSSSEVYASTINRDISFSPTLENVPLSIEDVRNPRWSYATGKLFGEVAIQNARIEHGLRGAVIRYHNVYGPNMGTDHFVPDFVQRVKKKIFKIYGWDSTRSFLYIDDAIRGTLAVLNADLGQVDIFNLGTTEELKILSAARIILFEMGIDPGTEIELLQSPQGSAKRRVPNIDKAKKILGWEPKISFQEGIKKYLTKDYS